MQLQKAFLEQYLQHAKPWATLIKQQKHARRRCFAKPIYRNIPFWNTLIMVDNWKDSFRWETIFRFFPGWNNPFILLFVFLIYFKLEFHAKLTRSCINSLTPKSIPAGTKLILFGRYILNIYVRIVRYFLRTTKTQRAKIYLPTQRTNRRISYNLTSAKKIRF